VRCGRELTAKESVERGIGPVCKKKLEKEVQEAKTKALNNDQKEIYDYVKKKEKAMNKQIECRIETFDALRLPCNDYDCTHGSCPFATDEKCPRERIYLKKDLRPKYKHRFKTCSFCGERVKNPFKVHKHGTKRTVECRECYEKNKAWRGQAKHYRNQHNIKEVTVHV
jgi:hypothetical protein